MFKVRKTRGKMGNILTCIVTMTNDKLGKVQSKYKNERWNETCIHIVRQMNTILCIKQKKKEMNRRKVNRK